MELRLLDSGSAHVGAADRPFGTPRELRAATGRFWRPFGRKATDVTCGEATVSEVPFHAHEALQVLLPLSPLAVVGGSWQTTLLSPGTIHVTGPLELRAARSLDGAPFSTRVILVAPSVLKTIRARRAGAAHGAARQITPQVDDDASSVTELVVRDRDLYVALMTLFDTLRRPVMPVSCESPLVDCVTQLLSWQGDRSASPPRRGAQPPAGVARARDFLRANPVQNVTLDELARVSRLSKSYLLRSFCRAYGLTPHGYQMQLRLARARRLLDEGRPLSHVTYDAGFADQSHLTRRFAAFYGLTPARYARQLGTPPGTPRSLSPERVAHGVMAPSAA